jgi:hypothetical protein
MANVTTTVNTVTTSVNSQTQAITVTTNGVSSSVSTGQTGPQGPEGPKTLTVLEPFAGDSYTLFYSVGPKTLGSIAVGMYGSGSPSVTFTIKQATDRTTAGTDVVASTVITNTSAATIATLADPDILASSFVWVEILGVSGVVNEFHITLGF